MSLWQVIQSQVVSLKDVHMISKLDLAGCCMCVDRIGEYVHSKNNFHHIFERKVVWAWDELEEEWEGCNLYIQVGNNKLKE